MSKANDTFENVEAFTLDLGGANTFTVRQFSDAELQQVSGGGRAPGNVKWGDIVLKGS
jgi:hypothetical protein